MKSDKLRVGLIGLGEINRAHVEGYLAHQNRVEITAVCDINPTMLERRSRELGATPYTDVTDLLRSGEVDMVDITLPHNLHFSVAKLALEAGKHVLVEKPLAPNSQDCLRLIELARDLHVTFTVAENTPFVAAYQVIEEILRTQLLGDIRLVRTFIYGSEITRLSNRNLWKGKLDGSNGGAIIDAGPHSFYLLKWLFGEIDTVQAVSYKLVRESEVEDNAIVSGCLKNGTIFSTEYTFTAEIPWGERLEIYGSMGSVVLDQLADPPVRIFRGKDDFVGSALEEVPYNPVRWKFDSIAKGVQDFVDAVLEGRSPRVDPMDGYYAVRVAEKAYESIRLGGVVVPV